ncbi:hypothetical protein C7S13_8469 [Burkholderia cepacia]|nr:hypothetical protein [Burkholderia cepacia]
MGRRSISKQYLAGVRRASCVADAVAEREYGVTWASLLSRPVPAGSTSAIGHTDNRSARKGRFSLVSGGMSLFEGSG